MPITDSRLPGPTTGKALVVEDEMLLFLSLEDELKNLGFADVLHASAVDDAVAIVERERPDLAILDVNLAGELVFLVARKLAEAQTPFFFVTGYLPETIPEEWAGSVVLQKPLHPSALRGAI